MLILELFLLILRVSLLILKDGRKTSGNQSALGKHHCFVLWRMKRRSRNMATMPNESEINALLVKPATRNVKNDTEAAVSAYGN